MSMGSIEPGVASPALTGASSTDPLIALFTEHGNRLRAFAVRLGASMEDSRDVVQEAFVRAAGSASFPETREKAVAWLARTIVNLIRDRERRHRARREFVEERAGSDRNADRRGADPTIRIAVRQALAALPARRRAVVVLHEIEGRSTAEIAEMLGVARPTIRWHLMQGRRFLIRRLIGRDHRES